VNEQFLNKVLHGSCFEWLPQIEDGSVDLLLTDPPYNVSQKSNFHTMGRKGVDFGEWDKGFDQSEWLELACKKIKKTGSILVFNDYKNIGFMKNVLDNNGFIIKELLIWKKANPMPRNRDRLYVTSIEVALWAVKGKGWAFNRQRGTYENGIFESPIVNHKQRKHPTQKPLSVIEEMIKIHTNENDVVLDCFLGSGTTAVACTNTNRNFIGIEKEWEYCEIANERIKNTLKIKN
jgi:site-specific DNA-methyltransferase (adenine-specific)